MLSDRCLSCLFVCLRRWCTVHGETVGWIKMNLGMQVGLGPGHIVLDWDPAPPPLKGQSPQFSAHICCCQMGARIKMSLRTEVGLDPSDIVLKRGQRPPISAHVYCDRTAAWVKMQLGMEIGLGLGHIVLDGDTISPSQNVDTASPIFGPCLLWPNGWMDQSATW